MSEYGIANVDEDLKPFPLRGIRQAVLDRLEERISNRYNPARPLIVVPEDGTDKYLVVDGNHRLEVLKKLGIKEVPVLKQSGNPYFLGVQANEDENTYAPMDVFDWLEIIGKLRDEGYKQKEIAETIGWKTKQQVSYYNQILENVSTEVLDFCKQHQKGRVDEKSTSVNFTEGWFRDSGIYDLPVIKDESDEILRNRQQELLDWFITKRVCNATNQQVKTKVNELKRKEEWIAVADKELINRDKLDDIINKIEEYYFKNINDLKTQIDKYNKEAQNKLLLGDARDNLSELEDNEIDLVITDPPYGINFVSNRRVEKDNYITNPIEGDDLQDTLNLLDDICQVLTSKLRPNGHLYLFTTWKTLPEFKGVISNYFTVKNVLAWVKNSWTMGDLKGNYAEQYELIIFATNGEGRPLNSIDGKERHANVLEYDRVGEGDRQHPAQKPIDLLEFLVLKSSNPDEVVCDPFMGIGSTCKAAQNQNRHYIGIELEQRYFDIARRIEK